MSEPVFLGFDIIVLLIGWQYIVRRTALDAQRDRLFDLREDVRKYYIENGYGLGHNTYQELRLLINNQIRFLESESVVSLAVWRGQYKTNQDFKKCIDEFVKGRFATKDERLAEYIKKVRTKAYEHSTGYMVFPHWG